MFVKPIFELSKKLMWAEVWIPGPDRFFIFTSIVVLLLADAASRPASVYRLAVQEVVDRFGRQGGQSLPSVTQ